MSVGLVGCGYWGKNLLRNFNDLGALRLVCEPNEEHRRLAAQLAPGVVQVTSFAEALASPIQALAIATPATTHYQLVLQALQAGKDVFVEKPLATTLKQGLELHDQASKLGRILMVGHILEYHPACLQLVRLIQNGELGSVSYAYSHRLSLGKIRCEEDVLWSFAPHDVALLNRVLGGPPLSVAAFGGSYLQKGIADVMLASFVYPGGVHGHIHVSWLHPFKEQRLVVVGSRKMASFDGVKNELLLYDERVDWHEGQPLPIKDEGQLVSFAPSEPLHEECKAFLKALRTRKPPLTDGRNGVEVLAVLEAATRSYHRQGQVEPLSKLVSPCL